MKPEELLVAALSLPASERVYLATRLLESVSRAEQETSEQDLEHYQQLDQRVAELSRVVRAEDSWLDG